ncbi:MAG: Ku protein [Gemmatimonadetes bacterium]|nr:Ku protein [Gemmatimonadota bacterium]
MPEAVRARAFWSGTISFGLVSIPVNLFSANQPRRVSLRMLSPEGTPLARRYYDPETGREVTRDEIVRGYEVEEDRYVVVTDAELEALAPEKSRDIDLRVFVDREAIDPMYFDRAYFLTPGGNSTKAYRLLAATMEETNRAGIATFVMRTKEYLVAILAENGILRAETLRFHDEVRPVEEIGLPDAPKVPANRVKALEKEIEKRSRASLEEEELKDSYAERLLALVERKKKEGSAVVQAPAGAEEEDEGSDVIDLMEVLKRSLQGDGPGRKSKSAAGDLEALTKAELYERAQELDLPGRSGMNKNELIRALRKSA